MDRSESPDGSITSDISETVRNQVDDWSSNTTEACEIVLFRGADEIASFSPDFTYPIFGEEEAVFGYKGLEISLSFASHNLKPHVDISWDELWNKGDIKPSDIRGALEDFLPASAFDDQSRPKALSESDATNFSPPGTHILSYKINDQEYGIWYSSLADPLAKEMMENAQVLVPLFIEGGTELQLDDERVNERWKVFLVYKIHKEVSSGSCPYELVGFSTSYRVFTLPDRASPNDLAIKLLQGDDFDWSFEHADESVAQMKSPSELPSRERISQFLILPPYQRFGHGPQLYNAMYSYLVGPENILELTVEDPNEAFDDMRDACDMVYLRETNDDFASLTINSNIDATKLKPDANIPVDDIVDGAAKERIRLASKIIPRQSARLVEMQTLSKIPTSHRNVAHITRKEKCSNEMDRAYYFWRLYVKHRLYETHKDLLKELDPQERVEKLEATLDTVQEDYARLLSLAEKRAKQSGHVVIINQERKNRKRKLVADDDDIDDDVDSAPGAQSSKPLEVDATGDKPNNPPSDSKKRKISMR